MNLQGFCSIQVVALVALLSSGAGPAWAAGLQDGTVESQLKFVAGDEQGNEVKALKTELLVSKSENLALVQLQRLIAKYKGSAMEPELWFRMAEMHMRRSKTAR